MKKIEINGEIKEEAGVVMLFAILHKELGFPRLVPASARGFDIASIEYKGMDVTVEFEYLSSHFKSHGHTQKMEDERKYVVICWEDDCGLATSLIEEYDVELYDIIELRNYVTLKHQEIFHEDASQPLYVILSYNPNFADKMDFGEWAFSNCYRTPTSKEKPKFSGDKLPKGSKILFSQNGYIVGGFTVERYEVIDCPKSKREKELYIQLTNYPISLYTLESGDLREENFTRGHIFYTDFFDVRNLKKRLSDYIGKNMSNHGKININKATYDRIMGH